ncbi:hypothetical protein [Dactylosporangium fulvum]|uniref:Uncharacterized protein n=1 Tax=Dactylosporangium fulvum TaxID=53359 RepID=A0ABY5VQZ4_9ACTN|nr:hypothetical protein [Dactylosporangium fulvum]UWP79554.1 hypothetical protein Dfulv_30860 [Dactylosporangium fulvum]
MRADRRAGAGGDPLPQERLGIGQAFTAEEQDAGRLQENSPVP